MKKLLLVASLLASFAGEARSLKRYENAELSVVAQQPKAAFGYVDYGSVQIDYFKMEVEVILYRHSHCPKGAICILSIPMPITVRVKIETIDNDNSGIRTITARTDRRLMDGVTKIIVIKDFSNSILENAMDSLVQVEVTESYYNRVEHKGVRNSIQLKGDKLQ